MTLRINDSYEKYDNNDINVLFINILFINILFITILFITILFISIPQAVEVLERALNACTRSFGKDDPRTLEVAFETAKMQLKTG